MAKVMDLVNALDADAKQYDVFLENLLSANDDLPSDVDEVNNLQNAIISHVNSRLNQSTTRHDGLNVLLRVLPRCSKDILLKYAILWITKSSQTLENAQCGVKEITLGCKVLGSLITVCKDVPELQKHISMQTVKHLIVSISNLEKEKQCGATLYLIATMLYHYKEPCDRLQSSIRKIVLSFVDSDQKNMVQAAANCYILLSRATEKSFKPPPTNPAYTRGIHSHAVLCNSLHSIMDDLFTGFMEVDSLDVAEKLELDPIPEDNVIDYYSGLERRFANLCIYLSTMLRGCAGKNAVLPNDILQVLCRGLAVTPSNLGNEDTFKKQMLYFILPKLHISLFAVVNAFVEGFKQELVPFAITILQLYQQTLKWTGKTGENQTTISGSKPFKNVRIAVYKSLTSWMTCVGALSGIEIVSEDFLPHLLKDITPERERVTLMVQKTQHLSKRALKRFKDNQYENSTSLGSANVAAKDPCVNAELCRAALIVLENIFFNASCALKPSFYKNLQNVLVPLLYEHYLGSEEKTFYDESSECRLRLLRALKAIQMNPHPSTPPPTQYSIEIFGMALKDSDARVIWEAKLGIAELEKIAHPSAPTLQLPVRSDEGEKELSIHWSRPQKDKEPSRENGDAQPDNSVWERFRESRTESNASDPVQQNQKSRLAEPSEAQQQLESTAAAVNGTAESSDGPPPSKQQKLDNQNELMDTSEDELSTPPPKEEESPPSREVEPLAYESPTKETSDLARRTSGELPASEGDEPSYYTLKEIQGNATNPGDAVENSRANDNKQNLTEAPKSNGQVSKDEEKANVSKQQVQQDLDDNSDDEAILSLFCDELKDE